MSTIRIHILAAAAALAAVTAPAFAQTTEKPITSDPSPSANSGQMDTAPSANGSASGTSGSASDTRSGRYGQSIPQGDAGKPTIQPETANPKEFPGAGTNSR